MGYVGYGVVAGTRASAGDFQMADRPLFDQPLDQPGMWAFVR